MIKEITVENAEKELQEGITLDGSDFNIVYKETAESTEEDSL